MAPDEFNVCIDPSINSEPMEKIKTKEKSDETRCDFNLLISSFPLWENTGEAVSYANIHLYRWSSINEYLFFVICFFFLFFSCNS